MSVQDDIGIGERFSWAGVPNAPVVTITAIQWAEAPPWHTMIELEDANGERVLATETDLREHMTRVPAC